MSVIVNLRVIVNRGNHNEASRMLMWVYALCSFVLSLGDCNSCLVLDDELNVLPLSKAARGLTALPGTFIVMCPSLG